MSGELLIDLWFPGKPFGKARPRHRVIPLKGSEPFIDPEDRSEKPTKFYRLKDIITNSYNKPDARVDAFEAMAEQQISAANFYIQTGAVRVDWCAFFQAVRSEPEAMRMQKARGDICVTKKPDKDNIAKLIFDALNEKAWLDDKQVCWGTSGKVYSSRPEGVRVRIYKADPQAMKRWHERNFPPMPGEDDFHLS